MKKIFYVFCFCSTLLTACQENEMDTFDSSGAVYFQLASDWNNATDSVIYSFAGNPLDFDTLWLQVDLMGKATDYDRTFLLAVDKEHTTAVEGTHYEALKSSYTLPAGTYQTQVPVVLYNKDPLLETDTVFQLALQLKPTEDLQLGLGGRTNARVLLTAYLMKPSYWDEWGMYYIFGTYSKKKHEIIIQELGRDFPPTLDELNAETDYWYAAGYQMDNYFEEHTVIDPETGYPIEPWF